MLSSKAPILEVAGLTIRRGGTEILRDIAWRVEPGQHWLILGPNGSGKTSLLGALTGYLTPTAGRLDLLGRQYGRADWPALRRRVGLVSSSLRQMMHEDETALEIVMEGRLAAIDLREPTRGPHARRGRELLAEVGCSPLASRPWAYLSQGERQRVLIARALMARPEILILDEPCAGLDPVAREQFLGFLSAMGCQPHPSLVFVTHHVEEILPVFGQTLLLRDGSVIASGPTRAVLNSATLSRTFGAKIRVAQRGGRWSLHLAKRRWKYTAPKLRRRPPVKAVVA
ncbi:MAG: ATP-binding cassette domain-containing protein [Verrucomicrobiales bacterium]|nr:ATP-binding cassette domain-containing protein [Verrucomicrobiales bacterium]